jgi:hypothetical protein
VIVLDDYSPVVVVVPPMMMVPDDYNWIRVRRQRRG